MRVSAFPWLALGLVPAALGQEPAPAPPAPAPAIPDEWRSYRKGEVPGGPVRVARTAREDGSLRTEVSRETHFFAQGAWKDFVGLEATEETAAGEVLRVESRAEWEGGTFTLSGEVRERSCHLAIRSAGKPDEEKTVSWPAGTLGPSGLERLRIAKGFGTGTTYRYLAFDSVRADVVSYETTVLGEEDVPLDGRTERAARLTVRPVAPEGAAATEWWAGGRLVRREDGDGTEVAVPAGRAAEKGGGMLASWSVSEVARAAGLPIPRPAWTTEAVFRLRLRSGDWGDLDLAGPGQTAARAEDGSVLVKVAAVPLRRGGPPRPIPAPAAEPLAAKGSFFATVDDPAVREALAAAVPAGADTEAAVRGILAACRRRLQLRRLNAGFATAAEALRQGEGDCAEFAVVAATLLRAAGVPARLAGGLLYGRDDLAYHLWVEAWLGSAWIPLDPTRPTGLADAARIRFGSAGLGEGQGGPEDALVGVGFVIPRLDVEVVEARLGPVRIAKGVDLARSGGGRFEHAGFGVGLSAPPDWDIGGPDMGIEQGIAVARGKRNRRIVVRAGPVPPHARLEDFLHDARIRYVAGPPTFREVAGSPAFVLDLEPRGGGPRGRAAYVLDGDALFVVDSPAASEDVSAALDHILKSWRWLGGPPRGRNR
ncbi:MAG: transglutaminase-like domain-containing protein [Planctomycetales bacterium]|nr:transglutaminase-like domain-containing protein [Planctomycetales bacterium]